MPVSLTGLVLIWFVKRRRSSGLSLAGVCDVACYPIYLFLIPWTRGVALWNSLAVEKR